MNWAPIYAHQSCEDQYIFFAQTLNGLIDKYFPIRTIKTHTKDKLWVTDFFKDLIKQRQFALSNGDKTLYNQTRNKINRLRPNLKTKFYDNKMKQLTENDSKQWWKNVKELVGLKQSSTSEALSGLANQVADGNMDKLSNEINSFFPFSIFTLRPPSIK